VDSLWSDGSCRLFILFSHPIAENQTEAGNCDGQKKGDEDVPVLMVRIRVKSDVVGHIFTEESDEQAARNQH
jgi:hypothetical protein